ncbi:hypothetical protein [Plesiomonas shigelloides]|uniref:hypothetical protein n=1 Tax=Plesiomonas shigelloides TaxID=703 RepID=UPI001261FE9A|nr:hypothetical protein [Plesiomonas shigelloides]KAB7689501.1 hypothetical protein GBN20_07620 [Plesiomonas shigelloides]
MAKIKAAVQNRYFLGLSAALTSGVASAAEGDMTSTITNAITAGQANVSMTIAGVVSVAALCFGAGLIVAWLRK